MFDYNKERAKLYKILYGRELEEGYKDNEDAVDLYSNSSNYTGATIAVMDSLIAILPIIITACLIAWLITAPSRFMDWFQRGGVEIKTFKYPKELEK